MSRMTATCYELLFTMQKCTVYVYAHKSMKLGEVERKCMSIYGGLSMCDALDIALLVR